MDNIDFILEYDQMLSQNEILFTIIEKLIF